jgi:hypothetical protein
MAFKRLLIVAFHYPPSHGSSGIQRTLKFSTYLREYGWESLVLTVSPRAYEQVSESQLAEIPRGMIVQRAFGLDAARHLSIGGRYFWWLAHPDRWSSWYPIGVLEGIKLIRRHRPHAILSTFPIATAHSIAHTLQRRSGLPWIADFRDAMTEPEYPKDPATRARHRALERRFIQRCTKAVFTAPGTLRMYAERYSEVSPSRWIVIENGFDEENFRNAEAGLPSGGLGAPNQMVVVHSGILYREERDPIPMFHALRRLKDDAFIDARSFKLVLRATGNDAIYQKTITEMDLADLVELAPSVPYVEALREMLRADGLLLLQGSICNHQVPAKLYEYARAGRPIVALTDFAGDTAASLARFGSKHVGDLSDSASIETTFRRFILDWRRGNPSPGSPAKTRISARDGRARPNWRDSLMRS